MSERPECGPMQFGDDWPGTFIRGDSSFAYCQALRDLIEVGETAMKASAEPTVLPLAILQARDLIELLEASDARGGLAGLQLMKPFDDSLAPTQGGS